MQREQGSPVLSSAELWTAGWSSGSDAAGFQSREVLSGLQVECVAECRHRKEGKLSCRDDM